MNKNQWFVLGIGLILMGFYFGFLSGINDCDELQSIYLDMVDEALTPNLNGEYIQNLMSSGDAWVISCLDKNLNLTSISTISFTLGVIFIIFGFLEPKKK